MFGTCEPFVLRLTW